MARRRRRRPQTRIEGYVPPLDEFGTTTDCHRALALGTVGDTESALPPTRRFLRPGPAGRACP